jgi:hypothetical protein
MIDKAIGEIDNEVKNELHFLQNISEVLFTLQKTINATLK